MAVTRRDTAKQRVGARSLAPSCLLSSSGEESKVGLPSGARLCRRLLGRQSRLTWIRNARCGSRRVRWVGSSASPRRLKSHALRHHDMVSCGGRPQNTIFEVIHAVCTARIPSLLSDSDRSSRKGRQRISRRSIRRVSACSDDHTYPALANCTIIFHRIFAQSPSAGGSLCQTALLGCQKLFCMSNGDILGQLGRCSV